MPIVSPTAASQVFAPQVGQNPATPPARPTQSPAFEQAAHVTLYAHGPVATGAEQRIDIVIEGARELYGAQVHVRFDPTVMRVEDANPGMDGAQLAAGEAFIPGASFVALNRVDHDKGMIDFAVTLLGAVDALQGRVVLASFDVRALQEGKTTLDFVRVILADRNGRSLEFTSQGLELTARS